MANRLKIGEPAPDITLLNPQGETVALSSLWENGPTMLEFIRHFG
jgi:peroxiredoxin